MATKATKAESYRVRAVELRAIAESMKGKEAREMLLNIADDYEHMAEQMDRLDRDGLLPRSSE